MGLREKETDRDILGDLPMFAGLELQEREALSRCASLVLGQTDDRLFEEGEPANGFFILRSGRVKMRKISPSGHEVVLHVATPPNMIGCRALTSTGTSYPATAVCMEQVEALRFTRDKFLQAVSDSPDVFFGLLIDLNRRLKEIYTLQSALMEPVEQRIATLLLHQALPKDRELSDWRKYPLQEVKLTKSVIGSIVGTSTETAIRILSRWKKKGLIGSERGSTRVLNPEAIYEIAQGS
ncbi:MAG: Crp/Fnr family transcriptional regulator [Acidobacteria bacterium]|nr:Crp/Fnr family transcriptional regulator [Acidobacteriota bacterium]